MGQLPQRVPEHSLSCDICSSSSLEGISLEVFEAVNEGLGESWLSVLVGIRHCL